jgi:hypothetical protein
MKDYSNNPCPYHKINKPFWKSFKEVFKRWIDREREIMSLRNVVGMMSEARRADAIEYQQMDEANREMRMDAIRFRWLSQDHAGTNGRGELRARVQAISDGICVNQIDVLRKQIDAEMSEFKDCYTGSVEK